jgi:hypothetical protein
MSIRIFPHTDGAHLGFINDEGRRYLIEFARGLQLDRLGVGAEPDPLLVDWDASFAGATADRVAGVVWDEDSRGYAVVVDGKPTVCLLTKIEVATLASQMPSRPARSVRNPLSAVDPRR